ncbi:MAG TPA: dienelactone hydrolase family protein, partial [Blastocatellia bacterium]|nr:dienelactone hydrolase family protein [Blastocatellia bacterium]
MKRKAQLPNLPLFTLVLLLFACAETLIQGSGQTQLSPIQNYYKSQVEQLEQYLDQQLQRADRERGTRWRRNFSSVEKYKASVRPNRERFIQLIGGVSSHGGPLLPRRTRAGETANYFIDRVWLSVLPGVDAYGILLIPRKSVQSPAPALICVHGMGSSPEKVCGLDTEEDYARRFGARAAERGYVVFAVLMTNDIRTKSRLDRKANLLGTRLQGLEQSKLIRVIDYLADLPEVDRQRIGIYGISWGGRTAMYTAAMDERIAATVISGHFNQNLPKMVTASPNYTAYIDTAEDYAFFSGLAREFSDSDIASLIVPRPVFIEQGTKDRVVYYPMAQAEFALLKSFYQKLGVDERAEFGLFEGGHIVYGD